MAVAALPRCHGSRMSQWDGGLSTIPLVLYSLQMVQLTRRSPHRGCTRYGPSTRRWRRPMQSDDTPLFSLRRCSKCREMKPPEAFRTKWGKTRLESRCKACGVAMSAARNRANPQAHIARNRRWDANHPERAAMVHKACAAVAYAISRGRLIRPDTCEECGVTNGKITAAHHDYSRPLDVRWLCRRCHTRWDLAFPKTLHGS